MRTLTTTGSGVGRIPGATGESLVTITGFVDGEGEIPSTWIENGALSVGLGSQGRVVIADQASFCQGAGTVTIGTTGEIDIGVGGLAGFFFAPAIVNDGVINFNFTDATTLTASVSGSGQLVKNGIGVLTLLGNNTYTGATTVNAGVLLAGSARAPSARPRPLPSILAPCWIWAASTTRWVL